MDDLTFSARRAGASTAARPVEPQDLETRFRTLVQSPLRAGILRYLSSRPDESFDVEALMHTFGRLRLDIENCVRELADFGVTREIAGRPPKYMAERPADEALGELLDTFLERRATVSTEDQSPSAQILLCESNTEQTRCSTHDNLTPTAAAAVFRPRPPSPDFRTVDAACEVQSC